MQWAADITKPTFYRGEPFAWAWLGERGAPAYMVDIVMDEMMPLPTAQHPK